MGTSSVQSPGAAHSLACAPAPAFSTYCEIRLIICAVTWWAFGLLTAGAVGLAWLLVSFLIGRAIEPMPVIFEYLMTLCFFPILTWMLARTQMAFLKDV